jgi:hypothetical protein
MTIYQTLYNSDNKNAEYQKRGKTWYKRKKGSDEKWYKVDSQYFANLNSKYKDAPFLYNYTTTAKVGAAALLVLGVYFTYKKFYVLPQISK